MSQIEQLREFKKDPRQQKQLEEMLDIINEAFEKNMSAYVRLVQMDVMKEFNARCDKDGVGAERDNFSHVILDSMMQQVDSDLNAKILSQFAKQKESMDL